jgi:hypothetical protein
LEEGVFLFGSVGELEISGFTSIKLRALQSVIHTRLIWTNNLPLPWTSNPCRTFLRIKGTSLILTIEGLIIRTSVLLGTVLTNECTRQVRAHVVSKWAYCIGGTLGLILPAPSIRTGKGFVKRTVLLDDCSAEVIDVLGFDAF